MSGYPVFRGSACLLAGTFAAFLSAAVPSANGQSTTELFDYPGTGLKGTVSAQPAVTLQECRLLCSSRSGCFGFDWSGAMCRLFASVDSAYDSPASTAGTRNLVPGYRPPSNPPARPVAVAPQAEPALPDAPEASGRRVSYRTIPGDPRPIAWVYINVCAGASVDATSLRRSVNDFVFEPLRLIPGQIERFDRDTTPQCASVPKAIGYAAPDADGWRIAAALKEMSPLLRPLGIGTRADGKLPAGDPDRYRIDIWLSHR